MSPLFFWKREKESGKSHESLEGSSQQVLLHGPISEKEYRRTFPTSEVKAAILGGSPRPDVKSGEQNFPTDFTKWREYREKMDSAHEIVVCGHHDGLGDTVHHIRYARAFAHTYPDKNIYFLTRNPEIFREEDLPQNLKLRKTSPSEELIADVNETSSKTVLFNPSLYQPIIRKQFGGKDSQFVFAETQTGKEGRDLFSAWSYTVSKVDDEQNHDLRRFVQKSKKKIHEYFTYTAHQIIDQTTKLRYLFDLSIPEDFDIVPVRIEENIHPGSKSDVLIFCDAAEGNGTKLLEAQSWAELIFDLLDKNMDNLRIKIVRGRTHPDFPEEILRRIADMVKKNGKTDFPRLAKIIDTLRDNIVDADIPEIMQEIDGTRLVITLDTGLGHIANEQIRKRNHLGLRSAQILSLVGLGPFNPLFYRLDQGKTLVSSDQAQDISTKAIASLALESLKV